MEWHVFFEPISYSTYIRPLTEELKRVMQIVEKTADLDFNRGLGRKYGGTIPSLSYNFNPSVINKNSSTIQRFSSGGSVRGYAEGGTFERLMGTVRGTGSMMVDSVKALLAPGEEIIRATSAMLFRPLLKDINDNAGRMWVKFSEATKKLLEVSSLQTSVSEEFAKVIEDHNQYLKDDIIKKRTGQGGGR